jgi:hypothetical protein
LPDHQARRRVADAAGRQKPGPADRAFVIE